MIQKAEKFIADNFVWTNAYGLARSVLAFATFITLVFNSTSLLFISYGTTGVRCDYFGISIFCLIPDLEVARWVCVLLLIPVVAGWRPMITGIIHWYICYSFINSATLVDGGDHIASILSVLLIPITLTDTRKWHWDVSIPQPTSIVYQVRSLVALSCLLVIKIQMAVIYLNSAVGKLFVPEWKDGTAIYYWFKHPLFGYPSWLSPILEPMILNGSILFLITWGTIIFELILFAGLFMEKTYKRWLLFTGIFFHFGIVLVHGLGSFFFTMTAGLILFLYPVAKQSTLLINLKSKIYDIITSRRRSVVTDGTNS